MNSSKDISASAFRMEKEQPVLFISLLILIILILTILSYEPLVSLVLMLALIGISTTVVKVKQKQLLGNSVKVSPKSFPEVYKAAQTAADRLSMNLPDVFVMYDPRINAFALGLLGKKSIVLHSSLVESMKDDKLIFIIGHELSHIKCGHTSWLVVTNSVSSIRIPVISTILEYLFLFWNRITEYTADRGALISCRDLESATSAMIILAVGKKLGEEVDPEDFIKQVITGGQMAGIAEILLTHPYIVNRVKSLAIFFNSENYKSICKGNFDFDRQQKASSELKALLSIFKDSLSEKNIKPKIKSLADKLERIFQHVDKNLRSKSANDIKEPNKQSDKPNSETKKDNNPEYKKIEDNVLLQAVLDEHLELVKDLFKKGANPNAVDGQGDTLLHISVMFQNYELTKIILDHGAYIDQPNKKGETPISIAQKNNLPRFFNLMKKYRSALL